MALRTIALCHGEYIGIESIITLIDGKQINIPDKLKDLRRKSRNKELFCPCGCGSNLFLVAGENNTREQHFRIDSRGNKEECTAVLESNDSINSKIVLKWWLNINFAGSVVSSRIPIHSIDDINRKYEFTFLIKDKGFALSYCHNKINLSEEKMKILQDNSKDISILYITDSSNMIDNGQYPESLDRMQSVQGFCLFLNINEQKYDESELSVVFYAKNERGLWQKTTIYRDKLVEFHINENGKLEYIGNDIFEAAINSKRNYEDVIAKIVKENEIKEKNLEEQRKKEQEEYINRIEAERKEREERLRRIEEERRARELQAEKERIKKENEEKKIQDDRVFAENFWRLINQQEHPVIDPDGTRWYKCKLCRIAKTSKEFASFGGPDKLNKDICKKCSRKNIFQRNSSIY